MSKVSLISLCVILVLAVSYSRPIEQSTVCNSNVWPDYLFVAYQLFFKSRSQPGSHCTDVLQANEKYCECNSITGVKGTLKTSPSPLPNGTSENATESTANDYIPEDDTDEISLNGCWLGFKMNIEKSEKKILGGDLSVYRLPIGTTSGHPDELTVKVYDREGKKIQQTKIFTDEMESWTTLQVNDYALSLPYGENEAEILLTVETSSNSKDLLTCDEIQQYFVLNCSAPMTTPASMLSAKNLEPMMTIFVERRSTTLQEILKQRKRRAIEKSKGECRLHTREGLLSEFISLEEGQTLVRDTPVKFGSCHGERDQECAAAEHKSIGYLVKDSKTESYLIDAVKSAVKC